MTFAVTSRIRPLIDPVARVRKISRTLSATTAVVMVVVTLAVAGAWIFPVLTGITLVPRVGAFKYFFADPSARFVAFAMIMVLLGIFLFALEQARRLFGEFAAGEILTLRAAVRLQWISYAVIVGAIARPLAQIVLRTAFEASASAVLPSPLLVVISLRDVLSYLAFLLAGLLLLAIAWVLAEAARIADDHRQIV